MPPNTTSRLQPLDAGIIQNFKTGYHGRVLKRLLVAIDNKHDTEFAVSLKDAIDMCAAAWNTVTQQCIANCYRHAGFQNSQHNDAQDDAVVQDGGVNSYQTVWEMVASHFGLKDTFADFVAVDDDLPVAGILTDEQIVKQVVAESNNPNEGDVATNDAAKQDECPIRTTGDAMRAIHHLRQYLESHCDTGYEAPISALKNCVTDIAVPTLQQTKISDFFKPTSQFSIVYSSSTNLGTSRTLHNNETSALCSSARSPSALNAVVCAVCALDCDAAHFRKVCYRAVHAICGQGDLEDEGYGSPVVCRNCKPL